MAGRLALAIAARTYALYQCRLSPPDADYDLYSGERSQVYRGLAGEDAKARAAIQHTRGVVLTEGGAGQRRIFEAFFSTRKGGTGLGLAIVDRIGRAHGAEIEITPVEPHGTRVRLVFAAVGSAALRARG